MKSSELIVYILDYLDNNLYRDISIQELSLYFGYEKSYIMKKFKNELGISIKTYVNKMKIISSLNSLGNNDLLIKTALEYGFNSLEYYSEVFSKVVGVSPTVYKKYLIGQATKDELEIIREFIEELTNFNLFLEKYRASLKGNENKILRLTIPNEKKCA